MALVNDARLRKNSPGRIPIHNARVEKLHSNNGVGIEINYEEKPPQISIYIYYKLALPQYIHRFSFPCALLLNHHIPLSWGLNLL
jgi:hypothetical protein